MKTKLKNGCECYGYHPCKNPVVAVITLRSGEIRRVCNWHHCRLGEVKWLIKRVQQWSKLFPIAEWSDKDYLPSPKDMARMTIS